MDYGSEVMFLLLLPFCIFVVSEGNRRVPISVTPGVYLRRLERVDMYEASVPLVYKSKLPEVEMAYLKLPEVNGFCEGFSNDPKCVLYSWVLQVDKQIGHRIKWLNTSLGIEEQESQMPKDKHRFRRSVNFVGRFAHYCCGVVTDHQLKPLVASQQVMSQFEHGLNDQLKEAFSEIDSVNFNMKNYSDQVEQTFHRVIDVGVNITKVIQRFESQAFKANQHSNNQSLSLLQLSTHHVIRQLQILQIVTRLEILSQCRERKLPSFVVTVEKLRSDLLVLGQAVGDDGYDLVIPAHEVTKYLKLEIADCVISGETILVKLKIPIRRQESNWLLYEVVTVPFAWNNSVCSVQVGAEYLAVSKDQLVTIQGPAKRDCDPYESSLCFVPRYTGSTDLSSLCITKILNGATIQELSSLCVFRCVTESRPIVSKISDFMYALTHVHGHVKLLCRYNKNETIDLSTQRKLGAVEITVPCDCKLIYDSQILISEVYPCDQLPDTVTVVHTIPAPWSKIKSLKINSFQTQTANTFETFSECLDYDWPLSVPHFNVTISGHRDLHEPKQFHGYQYYEGDNSLSLTTILSGITSFLVAIIIIRNPHLLGLYHVNVVGAEPLELYVDTKTFKEFIFYTSMSVCIVLGWILVRWIRRQRKRQQTVGEIELKEKREVVDRSELPRDLPLAEVDGRELRITLEWWDKPGPHC